MSYDCLRCNFQLSRNGKKYIHLDFDDTMTCKKFKAFSSIFPSYGCLYTTVKFFFSMDGNDCLDIVPLGCLCATLNWVMDKFDVRR